MQSRRECLRTEPAEPPMFTKVQHTFGPFQPIEAALKSARNARGFP